MAKSQKLPALDLQCPGFSPKLTGNSEWKFCANCKHNVHDLSLMTGEARQRLLSLEEPGCILYYYSVDGTLLSIKELSLFRRVRLKIRMWLGELLVSLLSGVLVRLRRARGVRLPKEG